MIKVNSMTRCGCGRLQREARKHLLEDVEQDVEAFKGQRTKFRTRVERGSDFETLFFRFTVISFKSLIALTL
jgi:hypothetical protein